MTRKSSTLGDFARLLSPISGHPAAHAAFLTEEVIKFPELMALVHPTNVVSAMFSLLGTGNADKFSSLWEINSQRPDVTSEFSTQLPENIASSLGTITPVYFERKLEALDKIPSLVSPLNTGLQQGLTRLANADWSSSINLPSTVEKALEHLGKRQNFFVSDNDDRMTALKQIIAKLEDPQQHQRPSAMFSLLTGIAKRNAILPEVMIDAAEQNKSAISDPYRCHEVETFISGLRRLAPAVPTAA